LQDAHQVDEAVRRAKLGVRRAEPVAQDAVLADSVEYAVRADNCCIDRARKNQKVAAARVILFDFVNNLFIVAVGFVRLHIDARRTLPTENPTHGAYQRAALEYVNSLTELQGEMGHMPKYQYDRLYSRLEVLKARADQAKVNYDSHVREHGC
jgi:hypothetical protein